MAKIVCPPCKRSEQFGCWLIGSVRALLAWVVIGISTVLPLSHLPDMGGGERAFLIAAFVLSVITAFGLLLWAPDAVRERS